MNDCGTFQAASGCLPMGSYKPPEWYSTEPTRDHNERGGLFMTETEAYDMRERMRAVEIQIRYMNDEMKELRTEMKDMGSSVRSLVDLVSQAKGARYMVGLAFMVIGALAAYAPTLVRLIWAMK